jgi:hypothetical protein
MTLYENDVMLHLKLFLMEKLVKLQGIRINASLLSGPPMLYLLVIIISNFQLLVYSIHVLLLLA